MTTLTLIVPCYNEEDALPPLFEQLGPVKKALAPHAALDLLFVNDGSKDQTAAILEKIPAHLHPARVVHHEVNRGLGAAIRTGFEHASGDLVALMDVDCTYDPMYLVDMLPYMKPDVDIVTGSEFHPQGKVENITWMRLFLSRNLSRLYRIAFRSDLYSFSCLLRIYRRRILADIGPRDSGFLSCTEVLLNAHKLGYKIVEFPLVLTERQHGESKMPIIRTIFDHSSFILANLLGRSAQPVSREKVPS